MYSTKKISAISNLCILYQLHKAKETKVQKENEGFFNKSKK